MLRFALLARRTWLVPMLFSLAGCTTQALHWDGYRAEPPPNGGEAGAHSSPHESEFSGGVHPVALTPGAEAPRIHAGGGSPAPRVIDPGNPFTDLHVLEPYLEGVASWYGPGFHGEVTANGETYNQFGLTAAHPMLPLGTKIEVENLANGRKVWLRVNDRGPYKKGRILDLSKLAAERLGIVDEGTAPVSIRVLRWPEAVDARLGLRAYTQFVVQVVSRPDPVVAESYRARFDERFPGMAFQIDKPPGGQYSVIAGPFADEQAARAAALRLQREGVTSLVRSYRK